MLHNAVTQVTDLPQSIAQLVRSAGLAIQTLTATQGTSSSSHAREAFTNAVQICSDNAHSISVRMLRQVDGLKEAGIISTGRKEDDAAEEAADGSSARKKGATVNLDVGFMNSRSRKVDTDMEAETWAQARAFLERVEMRQGGGDGEERDFDSMQT